VQAVNHLLPIENYSLQASVRLHSHAGCFQEKGFQHFPPPTTSLGIKHLSDALFHFFLSTFNNSELKDENVSFWPLTVLHMIYTQLEIESTGK